MCLSTVQISNASRVKKKQAEVPHMIELGLRNVMKGIS